MRVFLLEDDKSIQKGLSLKLVREGHDVVSADCIAAAESAAVRRLMKQTTVELLGQEA